MTDALSEMLVGLARIPDILRRSEVQIEAESDPAKPGRTAYRLTGFDKQAVQYAIDRRMQEAEERGGYASFVGPIGVDGGFGALGEIVIPVAEGAE